MKANRLHELSGRCSRQILREKLIDPESALIGRAQMGLGHILYELGTHANPKEIWQRVLGHRLRAKGDDEQ